MLNRRQFPGALAGDGNAAAVAQPNIVYIMPDDHAAQAIGTTAALLQECHELYSP